jgi:hypothetical protein
MRNFDDPIPMFQMLSLKNTMKRIHMKFKRPFWFFSPAAVLAHVLYLVRERKIKEPNIREKGKKTPDVMIISLLRFHSSRDN